MARKKKFDPSAEAERPDSVSAAVNQILVEEFNGAVKREAQDPFAAIRGLSDHLARTYTASFEAAMEEFKRRGWPDAYDPSHQVAAMVVGRMVAGVQ